MAITVEPQGTIRLIRCNLESDYKNTFTFTNATNQKNYFDGLTGTQLLGTDYTYIRKDNKISVGVNYDSIATYNYLYYDNIGFNGHKIYYCFIDRLEYVNENCTNIYFHTDVFQTWYFQITWNRCFVEREHVNSDGIGEHTIPEGLETGEYIQLANPVDLNNWNNGYDICLCVSDFPNNDIYALAVDHGMLINNIFSGLFYCIFHHSNFSTCMAWVNEFIRMYDSSAKANAIISMFLVPQAFSIDYGVPSSATAIVFNEDDGHWFYLPQQKNTYTTLVSSVNVTQPTTQGGNYSPKNNKLKVYPYMYMNITNNAGTDVIMNYEDFVSNTPSFKIIGSLTPGMSIRCIPLNYKKLSEGTNTVRSFNFSIPGGKLPISAWSSDTYTNWLTENGLNLAIGVVGGAIMVGTALASGGTSLAVTGVAVGGATSIWNSLGSMYKHSLAPDQARGNTSVGDVTFSAGKSVFTAYRMGLREENARVIDDYFSMFGYKVNKVKVPNITGRSQWNFVKTIDCNCDGNIPQEDLETIRKAMNTGVTFWHTPANIYNYSLSNNIV